METKVSRKTGLGMGHILRKFITGSGLAAACLLLPASHAWSAEYSTAQAGAINGATSCTANTYLERIISVDDAFTVSDLDLGLLVLHPFRGDIELNLRSPQGTEIQLINSNTNNGFQDNYNVELDDQAGTLINTAPHNTNDGTAAPPYENQVRPNNIGGAATGLSAFTGQAALGDWTLRLCDAFNALDDGTFQNATLFFSSPTDADLDVTLTPDTNTPTIGSNVTLTLTVSNSGPNAATAAQVTTTFPAGLTFVSAAGAGSYDAATNIWSLPNLPSGNSETLTITAQVAPTGPYSIASEITTAPPDPDSFAGNGSTDEDDDAQLTLSPVPPTTPPPLTCPIADQSSLIWEAPGGTFGWDSTDLSNSYTVGGLPVSFTMSGNTNRLIPRNGVPTPVTGDEFTGGNGFGVLAYADFAATSEQITTVIDLGVAGEGVGEIVFNILDVDEGVWTDRITITASLGGTNVPVILTPGGANEIQNGNQVVGTAPSIAPSTAGNAGVSILGQVDQITLVYDNASPTANPEPQIFSLFHDFAFCPPPQADLNAIKTVDVYDPTNQGDLYAVPGQDMIYRIEVTNSADATAAASDITLLDTLPDTVSFVSASTTGFTGGNFGTPDLPPTNTDCAGGACVISFNGASLPINATGEVLVIARVK